MLIIIIVVIEVAICHLFPFLLPLLPRGSFSEEEFNFWDEKKEKSYRKHPIGDRKQAQIKKNRQKYS